MIKEDVIRLDVTVNHLNGMDSIQRRANAHEHRDCLVEFERAASEAAAQIATVQPGRHNPDAAVIRPEIIHRHDTRMIQTLVDLGFDAKPLNGLHIAHMRRKNALKRHPARGLEINTAIHDALAP
jgi:hypothetical protein